MPRLAAHDPDTRRKAARARAEEFRWADTARAMLDLHGSIADDGLPGDDVADAASA